MVLIKRLSLIAALALTTISSASFAQDLSEDAIANRIAPVGDVYLDGEIATASTANEAAQPSGPRSGEQIYNSFCVACHATGAAGAPIKGDAAAWAPRIAQGRDTLNKHAIEGLNNVMPARGTCADCSDDEIIATVDFLIKGL